LASYSFFRSDTPRTATPSRYAHDVRADGALAGSVSGRSPSVDSSDVASCRVCGEPSLPIESSDLCARCGSGDLKSRPYVSTAVLILLGAYAVVDHIAQAGHGNASADLELVEGLAVLVLAVTAWRRGR